MLHDDVSFARSLDRVAERFKIQKDDGNEFQAVLRCPFCGDSQTDPRKRRGYIFNKDASGLLYYCHNCHKSAGFSELLRQLDGAMWSQYRLTKFSEFKHRAKVAAPQKPEKTVVPDIFSSLKAVTDLRKNHPARVIIENRMIPGDILKDTYYAPRFFKWTREHSNKFANPAMDSSDHSRWIIPWYAEDGSIIGYQARAFGVESPKYYTMMLDKSAPKVYGLERVDWSKRVYVLEGPIDSMMVENGIAVGDGALHRFKTDRAPVTYVVDCENRNPHVLDEYRKLIKADRELVMWTPEWTFKDLNEARCAGWSRLDIKKYLDDNTKSGWSALLQLNAWAKVKCERKKNVL